MESTLRTFATGANGEHPPLLQGQVGKPPIGLRPVGIGDLPRLGDRSPTSSRRLRSGNDLGPETDIADNRDSPSVAHDQGSSFMAAGLGISIGSATLVAVTDGSTGETQQVRLPSALQLDDGSVITGFVERVGDPIPILAADGTEYRGEARGDGCRRTGRPGRRQRRANCRPGSPGGVEPPHSTHHGVRSGRRRGSRGDSRRRTRSRHGVARRFRNCRQRRLTVVYDLGARSLDVTMMSTTDGRSEIFGKPLRSEDIGGDEFDHLVTVHTARCGFRPVRNP